jgi:hypothetical protein
MRLSLVIHRLDSYYIPFLIDGQKHEGNRPLRRSKYSREDNIKKDFKKVGCEGVDWIHIVQDRVHWWALVNIGMNQWVQ